MRARNVWAEVDLSAIAHNVQVTRKVLKPGTKICAVVKADAYGHGAVPVATAALAAGVNYLAVSMTQEAGASRSWYHGAYPHFGDHDGRT